MDALDRELRDAVDAPHEGLRKAESQWPIHQINWQRSRYVYDLYYKVGVLVWFGFETYPAYSTAGYGSTDSVFVCAASHVVNHHQQQNEVQTYLERTLRLLHQKQTY